MAQLKYYISILLALSFFICNPLSVKSNIATNEDEETVVTKIIPSQKNALFNKAHPVNYSIIILNHYRVKQEGTVSVIVRTAKGDIVGKKEIEISIGKGAAKKIRWSIPVSEPGFYDLQCCLALSEYDDTIRNSFGYEPFAINTPQHKPTDFDSYWQKAKDDLAAVDPDYKITLDIGESTVTHKVYKVEMTSLDNVRIYGWLTVPKVPGKFPVMYGLGGFRILMHPIFFDDFACFSINVRGVGKSYDIINPTNQEFLTLHIQDKNKYVYRGIYMDVMRGLDFILSHERLQLDVSRIGAFGGSQGGTLSWIVAAMSSKINFCIIDNPIFCDFATNFDICSNKPEPQFIIKNLMKYLNDNRGFTKAKMLETLSYFEVQNFSSSVRCPILLGGGLLDLMAPPTCTFSAYNKLSEQVKKSSTVFMFPKLAHEVTQRHNRYKSFWFYEKTVVTKPILKQ